MLSDKFFEMAVTWFLSTALGIIATWPLVLYRIKKVEEGLTKNDKEHEHFRTDAEHHECKSATCSKIDSMRSEQYKQQVSIDEIKLCVNKYLEDCEVK